MKSKLNELERFFPKYWSITSTTELENFWFPEEEYSLLLIKENNLSSRKYFLMIFKYVYESNSKYILIFSLFNK